RGGAGLRRGVAGVRRDDGRRRTRAHSRRVHVRARRARLPDALGHRRDRLPELGRARCLRLRRDRKGPRHQLPDDAGTADAPAPQACALLGQLPPARAAPAARARALQGLVRGGRAGGERRLGVADRRLARARAVRPDGDRLRRAPVPEPADHGRRLGRPSTAQGLPAGRRARALLGGRMTVAPERPQRTRAEWPIVHGSQYEGTRIPSPVPTIKRVPADYEEREDILRINFGPNHPSTHGVLRLIVDLDGEMVEGIEAVIGYLHTGFEKTMETKTWWKCVTYPERIDYVGYQNNELTF